MKSCDWWLDLKSTPVVYKAAGTGAIGDIEEGASPRDRRSSGGRHGGRCDARGLSSPLPGRLRLKNLRIASISILGLDIKPHDPRSMIQRWRVIVGSLGTLLSTSSHYVLRTMTLISRAVI